MTQSSNLRESAIALRQSGQSLKSINKTIGVPLSTLSSWLKDIPLTSQQLQILQEQRAAALQVARLKAAEWHRGQKALRLLAAKRAAEKTLAELEPTNAVLDLALAMLYFGEGTKTDQQTTIASSDAKLLRFVVAVLERNYGISRSRIRCDLHLRLDQDPYKLKKYWSRQLNIPVERFKHVSFDKRSANKATYPRYKGVCVIGCGNVAI